MHKCTFRQICVYISVKVPHISIEKYTTYKLERNNFVHKE